ncbi:MAG: CcoQ/FixQ family Cbb3-type cytochrome c oxidase assembly chaperone [Flavobacteriales bacterium]|nr:CcoQ/FixQ family Cbb3-type cytochrome c oxidase assembly chaperone [Flavobacteriales bacterium]
MLKYIKHHMELITGIEIFPIISFLIFFLFFIVVGIWVFTARKSYIDEMKNIPLD